MGTIEHEKLLPTNVGDSLSSTENNVHMGNDEDDHDHGQVHDVGQNKSLPEKIARGNLVHDGITRRSIFLHGSYQVH